MQRLTILILLLLAGCVSAPASEYTRPALQAHIELSSNASIGEDVAVFIISDYEQAVRTSLREKETLTLATTPQSTITVYEVGVDYAIIEVNNQQEHITKGEAVMFSEGALRLQLATS